MTKINISSEKAKKPWKETKLCKAVCKKGIVINFISC